MRTPASNTWLILNGLMDINAENALMQILVKGKDCFPDAVLNAIMMSLRQAIPYSIV
jgi:hypothetical protein